MDDKIVIFNALQTSLSGGIGRYSYELSKAIYNMNEMLIKIVIREEDKHLFTFVNERDLIVVRNIKNSKDRNYYEQLLLPLKVYKEYPDAIIHYPDTMAPLLSRNKVIITVHDISFKAINNVFTIKTKLWKNLITSLSLKKAYSIVSDTNFTKSEIFKYYPNVEEHKVDTIHCGFNNFSNEHFDYKKVSFKIQSLTEMNYILTVSTISPRKNMDRLIRAFNRIKYETDHNLIIAGKNGWMYESVYQTVDILNLTDRVIFVGEVNDNELKSLYKNAKVFVYPSLYEGFGLPPLEAMSFGVPCVVSNVTSIPEVVGDAGIYIDPYNENDISRQIMGVLNNKDMRESSINKGTQRVNCFSWQLCAAKMCKLYNQVFQGR